MWLKRPKALGKGIASVNWVERSASGRSSARVLPMLFKWGSGGEERLPEKSISPGGPLFSRTSDTEDIMRRFWLTALAIALLATTVAPAKADYPLERFWRNFWRTAKANNKWPSPYTMADREATRAPFQMMIDKGWQTQSTMNAHYFQEDGHLTEAGQEKVLAILTHVPAEKRMIRVERAADPELTQARLAAVQQAATSIMRNGEVPPVTLTDERAWGWPALEVDTARRKFIETMPDPRLPKKQGFIDGT